MFAVGGGSWIGVRGFRMALDLRLAAPGLALPEDFARPAVEAVDPETLRAFILDGFYVAVETHLEQGLALGRHGANHEDSVTPDDGAGMPQTRDGGFPEYVLARIGVPRGRRRSAAGRSAKLGPVGIRGQGRQSHEEGKGEFHRLQFRTFWRHRAP